MQILKELLRLQEESNMAQRPMELRDFVDGSDGLESSFPKLLKKKWDTPGVVIWHGLPLFAKAEHDDWNDDGPAFDVCVNAIHEYVKDGYVLNAYLRIENTLPDHNDGESDMSGSGELDMDLKFEDPSQDMKSVWWGFDSENDAILMGFDAWVSNGEDAFNEAFETAFKEMTELEFDESDDHHHEILNKAWKESTSSNNGFYGLVFRVTGGGKRFHVEEEYAAMQGGFFRADFYKLIKEKISSGKLWVSPHHSYENC